MRNDTIQEIIDIFNRDYPTASDETYEFFHDVLNVLRNVKSEWISIKDRMPETPKPDEGYCCFLVSDGSLIHMAYYTEDGWLFADSGEMKEMFYEVTHWMPLPDYPNHQRRMMLNE